MENNGNNINNSASNAPGGAFNEFEDLGAETRRYMAEHMGEFKTAGGGSIAEELRRFIEQDVEATADRPAVTAQPLPEDAGEETRRFMAADAPADTPVHRDAEPLPRRGASYAARPGEQAPRRPVQEPGAARRGVQEPSRPAAEPRRPSQAPQQPQRRPVQDQQPPRREPQGGYQQRGGERTAPARTGASAPPPRGRDGGDERRQSRRKYAYIALASLAAVAIIVVALVILLSGGGGDYDKSYSRAMELYIDGDYAAAIDALEAARRIDDTEEAVVLLARCHAALGDLPAAESVLSGWLLTHEGADASALLEQYQSAGGDGGELTIGGQRVDPESESLAISGAALTHADLEAVASLEKLRVLSLSDCAISDISALSRLTGLTSLTLKDNNIEDISPLRALTGLRTLYLSGNRVTDYTPLHALTSLTTLDISGMEITEEQLEELQKALPGCAVISDEPTVELVEITLGGVTFTSDVTELDLSGSGIDDISQLAVCEQLESLDLSGNEISDLSPLVGLSALRELNVSGNKVASLSPLMGLSALERLDVSANSVSSIAALSGLASLKYLDLSENALGGMDALAGLTALEELGLRATGIGDGALSALHGLASLRRLDIEENADLTLSGVNALREALPDCEILVTEELLQVALGDGLYDPAATAVDASGQNVQSLDGIERLTGLTQLDLSDNPGLDIAGLGQMTGLTELILSNCGLGDIGELSSLTRLLALDLGGNADITDISALASLERMQTLDLSGTGVTDVSVLEGLPRLNTLILTGCEIEDLSVLEDFHGLDYLDLSDTGISRTELLWLSTALPGCTIYT